VIVTPGRTVAKIDAEDFAAAAKTLADCIVDQTRSREIARDLRGSMNDGDGTARA
jgi:hypothetical protein